MAWWAVAGMAATSLLGVSSAKRAARKTQQIAGYNADLVGAESAEEERRMKREIAKTEGLTKAMSAASGVQMSGSREAFVQDMQQENKAQLSWLRKAGKQKQKVILAGGQLQAGQLKSQATASGIKSLTYAAQSLFGSGGLMAGKT